MYRIRIRLIILPFAFRCFWFWFCRQFLGRALPLLACRVLDVGYFKLAGMDDEAAVLANLDALDGETFLAHAEDGALQIGATEIWGLVRHGADSSLFLGASAAIHIVRLVHYFCQSALNARAGGSVYFMGVHGIVLRTVTF
jgi:hypothetical protein